MRLSHRRCRSRSLAPQSTLGGKERKKRGANRLARREFSSAISRPPIEESRRRHSIERFKRGRIPARANTYAPPRRYRPRASITSAAAPPFLYDTPCTTAKPQFRMQARSIIARVNTSRCRVLTVAPTCTKDVYGTVHPYVPLQFRSN